MRSVIKFKLIKEFARASAAGVMCRVCSFDPQVEAHKFSVVHSLC